VMFEDGAGIPLPSRSAGKTGDHDGREVVVGIRPEHFVPAGEGHALSGRVQVVEPLGSDTLIHFALGSSTLTARVAPEMRPSPGENLSIGVDPSRIHLFDAATERAIA
jgi:multiple sugar transport system ATP-binding protein